MDNKTQSSLDIIKGKTDEQLLACVRFDPEDGEFDYTSENFVALRLELSPANEYINLNWIAARIAEELYDRDVIDHEQMWLIQGD